MVWDTWLFDRPGNPDGIKIRVLVSSGAGPHYRNGWDRQQLGPYGMGFPALDVMSWDDELTGMGYERSTPEVEIFQVARNDGSTYEVRESSVFGPEFLRMIVISRKDGMPQVGSYNEATGRGGPAYATQIVPDADAMMRFLTEVFDLEVRSDRTWSEYPIPFRFSLVHARGSKTGHVALVEYSQEHTLPGPDVAPRPPASGMVIWTFPVTDIDALMGRAAQAGIDPVAEPVTYRSPVFGSHRAVTLEAPNGFLVEAVEVD